MSDDDESEDHDAAQSSWSVDYSFGNRGDQLWCSQLDLLNRGPLLFDRGDPARLRNGELSEKPFLEDRPSQTGSLMAPSGANVAANRAPSQAALDFSLGLSEGAGAGFAGYPLPFIGPSVAYQTGGNNVFGAGLQGYGQLFVGAVGLGAMFYPVNTSITGTLFYGPPMKTSDALSAGCVPSALFISPVLSVQITPSAISISVGWPPVLGLGAFGGVACSANLNAPFLRSNKAPWQRLP